MNLETSDETAQKLLSFYYCAYAKLVSYPYLHSELVPSRINCGDMNSAEQQCKCCAIRKVDLDNALAILGREDGLNPAFNIKECKARRLPANRYFRMAAVSVDIDTVLKSPDFIPSQIYIVCVILDMQKGEGQLVDDCDSSKLVPFFKYYVYDIKKRLGENIKQEQQVAISKNAYSAFLRCLSDEPTDSCREDGRLTESVMKLLGEAMRKFVQIHSNMAGFYSTLSKILYQSPLEDIYEFAYQ